MKFIEFLALKKSIQTTNNNQQYNVDVDVVAFIVDWTAARLNVEVHRVRRRVC